jgi:hypothetical protein
MAPIRARASFIKRRSGVSAIFPLLHFSNASISHLDRSTRPAHTPPLHVDLPSCSCRRSKELGLRSLSACGLSCGCISRAMSGVAAERVKREKSIVLSAAINQRPLPAPGGAIRGTTRKYAVNSEDWRQCADDARRFIRYYRVQTEDDWPGRFVDEKFHAAWLLT